MADIDMKDNLPRHIAVIMDGNGRWAKEKGLPRTAGHHAGIDRVKEIIKAASGMGLEVITFFAFSTENWSRPKSEVSMLMRYLESFLGRQVKEMNKNNIRLKVIGRDEPMPARLLAKIRQAEEKTAGNTGLTVVLALNYGSRQEIVDAAVKFAREVKHGRAEPESLNADNFGGYFYTAGLPDPDLLIRTSGEQRISNFLLWQLSYAELYFTRKYWPDFESGDLEKAIKVYLARERRFGNISG